MTCNSQYYSKLYNDAKDKNDIIGMRRTLFEFLKTHPSHEVLSLAAEAGFEDVLDQYIKNLKKQNRSLNDHDLKMPTFNAASNGHLSILKKLLAHTTTHAGVALSHASRRGHIGILEELISHCGQEDINKALNMAANFGKIPALKFLLPFQKKPINEALEGGVLYNHLSVVELLAPLCLLDDNAAIEYACSKNDVPAVEILLSHAKPQKQCSKGLAWACFMENEEMIDLLYPLSDLQLTLAHFSTFTYDEGEQKGRQVLQEKIAKEEKKLIGCEVSHLAKNSKSLRKI